jgi:predicted dehydrogenase
VRALEDHPRAHLAGLVRRAPGPGERSFDAVLDDSAVDALILCTPNRQHAPGAHAALEKGKHVLVEFPLTETASEGRALFERARRAERVLHVEHIELLSPAQKHQRERVKKLGRPLGGGLVFVGASNGWMGDAELAGSPALRAVARLHRLVDLFGEAEVSEAQLMSKSSEGYRLEVQLEFRAGGEALLVEERGPGRTRETRWVVRCEQGPLDDPPPGPPGSLFREDLDHFIARVERGVDSYVSEARVLHVLELVERIESLVRGDVPA